MTEIRMTVYDLPTTDLPYLAVMIMPDGTVVATAHDGFEEATARVNMMAGAAVATLDRV